MADMNDPAFPSGSYPGMELRDYFAAMAMQGILAEGSWATGASAPDLIPGMAYSMADAMLRQRAQDNGNDNS